MYGNLARVNDTLGASPHRRRVWVGYKAPAAWFVTDASATLAMERETEKWFRAWASQWVRETAHLSSISSRTTHPAFKKITDLGEAALPMLIGELEHRPDFWFPALRAVAGEDPVTDHMRGKFDEMRKAWLDWAKRKHIRSRDVRAAVP